jgi:multidrug efflux pump subunit AcrB
MDTSTFHVIIPILVLVVTPLAILGALANILGTDSRDMQDTVKTRTPCKW